MGGGDGGWGVGVEEAGPQEARHPARLQRRVQHHAQSAEARRVPHDGLGRRAKPQRVVLAEVLGETVELARAQQRVDEVDLLHLLVARKRLEGGRQPAHDVDQRRERRDHCGMLRRRGQRPRGVRNGMQREADGQRAQGERGRRRAPHIATSAACGRAVKLIGNRVGCAPHTADAKSQQHWAQTSRERHMAVECPVAAP